mgnify:CR=1 FL=1
MVRGRNPWRVDSIKDFYVLKCPECAFFDKNEHNFQEHAVDKHALSFILFNEMSEVDTIENKSEQDLEKFSFPHGPEEKKTYSRNLKRTFTSAKTSKAHIENHAISNYDIN